MKVTEKRTSPRGAEDRTKEYDAEWISRELQAGAFSKQEEAFLKTINSRRSL